MALPAGMRGHGKDRRTAYRERLQRGGAQFTRCHWRGEGGAQERELAAKYRDWAAQRAFDYPYVGRVLEGIAADYDREGEWQDSEAKIRKRLRY